MSDFYQLKAQAYFDSTVQIDPTTFLMPLAKALAPGASILDIGCGSGRDLRWLAERGFQPTGFERSSKLAALTRQHSGCPVLEVDFETFDFSSLAFPALLMVGALVHVDRQQFPATLKKILQALLPGGWLYLTMKEGKGEQSADDGRIFTLSSTTALEEIFSLLRKFSFFLKVAKTRMWSRNSVTIGMNRI